MRLPELIARYPARLTRAGTEVTVHVPEVAIGSRGFDAEVWRRTRCRIGKEHPGDCVWDDGGDPAAKNAFLDSLTAEGSAGHVLGRRRSVYFHQNAYNRGEPVAASWLISVLGAIRGEIINENFRLSAGASVWARACAAARSSDGSYVAGTRTVARNLGAAFFEAFAELVVANGEHRCHCGSHKGAPLRDATQQGHHINTDLFAATPEGSALVEIKVEDELMTHQLLALAFAAVTARLLGITLWAAVLRFDASLAEGSIERRDEHPISILVPADRV